MADYLWRHVDQLTQAFQDSGPIPHASFGERFWCGFPRFTDPAFRNCLCARSGFLLYRASMRRRGPAARLPMPAAAPMMLEVRRATRQLPMSLGREIICHS
jgi:hypothetical protein